MPWDRLIAITSMLLDAGILWILVEEFNYDKIQDEKKEYKRKKAKKEVEQPILREGTGGVVRKTAGEMRDLSKASIDVQTEIKS